jgi:hypothetical protein
VVRGLVMFNAPQNGLCGCERLPLLLLCVCVGGGGGGGGRGVLAADRRHAHTVPTQRPTASDQATDTFLSHMLRGYARL